MSSLKNLASKVVNGDAETVKVWRRDDDTIVVAGEGRDDDRDKWNGSSGEWKRALSEALADSVATISRANADAR
jgi:hypothetical protein